MCSSKCVREKEKRGERRDKKAKAMFSSRGCHGDAQVFSVWIIFLALCVLVERFIFRLYDVRKVFFVLTYRSLWSERHCLRYQGQFGSSHCVRICRVGCEQIFALANDSIKKTNCHSLSL